MLHPYARGTSANDVDFLILTLPCIRPSLHRCLGECVRRRYLVGKNRASKFSLRLGCQVPVGSPHFRPVRRLAQPRFELKSSRFGSGVLELDQRPRICEVAVGSNFCLLKRDLVPRQAPMAFWFNYDRVSDRVFKLPSCDRSRIPRVRVRQI